MIAFIIWAVCGLFFVIIGIRCFKATKPVGFWANAKTPELEKDKIKPYNFAMGKLWCIFGVVFTLTGLPLLNPTDILPVMLISVGGCIVLCIILMICGIRIENKYKK